MPSRSRPASADPKVAARYARRIGRGDRSHFIEGKCRDMRFTSAFALSTEVWPDSVHVGSAPTVTRSRCPHSPLLSLLAVHAFAVRALFVHSFSCSVRRRHKQPCARRNKTRNATRSSVRKPSACTRTARCLPQPQWFFTRMGRRTRSARRCTRARTRTARRWLPAWPARTRCAAGRTAAPPREQLSLPGVGCSHEGPTEGVPWCPTECIPHPWELSHRELPGVGLLPWAASTKSSGPRAAPSQC